LSTAAFGDNPLDDARSHTVAWRKSSATGSHNGNCVEIGFASNFTLVRDSKQPAGPRLQFSPARWRGFLGSLR
jgi:hypothetical protein